MSRLPIILAALLLAGVAAPVDAKPKKSEKSQKSKKKKKKDDRHVTKSTKLNMPRGWTWPPNRTMVAKGEACEKELGELGVSYTVAGEIGRVVSPMKPASEIGGVTFTQMNGGNPTWDCQLVLAVAEFAPRLYELGVREVKYGSAFRWSKVRVAGKTKNVLSRHGLGLALDVVSFVDADGREANVKQDYKRGDDLLLSIEQAVNDSGRFRVLLTPRNDPKSHSDHFHFEANPDYTEPPPQRPAS